MHSSPPTLVLFLCLGLRRLAASVLLLLEENMSIYHRIELFQQELRRKWVHGRGQVIADATGPPVRAKMGGGCMPMRTRAHLVGCVHWILSRDVEETRPSRAHKLDEHCSKLLLSHL